MMPDHAGTGAAARTGSPRVDPTAFIASTATVMGDVHLGSESSVWYGAVVRGDMAPIRIGACTNLQDQVVVHVDEGVPCTIGARVGVGHRAILHGCTVEDDCLVGMGAILLNHVRVGRGSVIAAGAVLREGMEVPPGSLVMGLPGRVARPVDEELRRRIEFTWRHYVEQARRHAGGEFPRVEARRSKVDGGGG
ncbi:MAG TPA: gamma carbonic anhydrase family protein [Gemmatimonadales bacterium]|nr:gamma carbonic anhydrase family protein [Gemmatimonadales bacterium]